jgi:hypothetical protein
MTTDDLVGDCVPRECNFLHISTGAFGSFTDGIGYATCFADAQTNTTFVVTNDHNGTKRKVKSTFDHCGNAGNVDYALIEFITLIFATAWFLSSSHKAYAP